MILFNSRYREELIYSATQQEILNAINLLERSPWTSHKVNQWSTAEEIDPLPPKKIYNKNRMVKLHRECCLY